MDLIPQKRPPSKMQRRGKKKIIIIPTSSLHTDRLGGFTKLRVQKPLVNEDLTESGGEAGVDSSLQDFQPLPFLDPGRES